MEREQTASPVPSNGKTPKSDRKERKEGIERKENHRQANRLSKGMMKKIHIISPVPSNGIHTHTHTQTQTHTHTHTKHPYQERKQ